MIADRRPQTAALIALMLDGEPGIAVTDVTSDRVDLVRVLARTRPDVLVLDTALTGGPGLSQIVLIQQASPGTRVLVVGMGDESAWRREASRHHASYLAKHSSLPAWTAAIQATAARAGQAL